MQQQMSQAMGYDRTSTMFSPDGRLLQVEYARKTVKQGTPAIGIICKDGVLLIADKRVTERLIISKSVEKIFQIDTHLGAAATGIVSDGRILVEKAQVISQQHRVTYDEPIDIRSLVKEICNIKQAYTQYGGARPFGVSILFAGVDDKEPKLFATDPTGIFFEYKATAVGEYEDELKDFLNKEFKENLNIQDGLKLGVKALRTVLGKDFDIDRLCGAWIGIGEDFKYLTKEEINKAK